MSYKATDYFELAMVNAEMEACRVVCSQCNKKNICTAPCNAFIRLQAAKLETETNTKLLV